MMIKKRIFVIAFSLLLVSSLFSLDKKNNNEYVNERGKVSGVVFDKETGTPLADATVKLTGKGDSVFVASMSTNKKGSFEFNIPFGKYKLRISFIGYKNFVKRIELTSENPNVYLGSIMLEPGTETTAEIEVEDEVPVMENQIDKKVYNVEKSLVSESGSVVDALKNLPSVTVDSDGKVYLRGNSNVNILINGMPSATLGSDPSTVLEQISSKMVETIEIMSNPSSKYDPEGTSGIINIVLKKKQDDGINGSLSLNAGTQDKYTSSINLTVRKNKFTINGNYSFRLFNMSGDGSSYKKTYLGDTTYFYNQISNNSDKMSSHFGTLGVDYEYSKKSLFSLSGNYNYREMNMNENSINTNWSNSTLNPTEYLNNLAKNNKGYGFDINGRHKLKFETPKKELTTSIQYSNMNMNDANWTRKTDDITNLLLLSQKDSTQNNMELFSFQSDFIIPIGNAELKDNNSSTIPNNPSPGPGPMGPGNPMGPNSSTSTGSSTISKVEMGVKGALRTMNSDYNSNYLDLNSQNWIYNNLTSNNFEYKEQIFSAYTNYTNKIFDIGYQFGVRLEQAFTKSNQLTIKENYENDYFSFFPSVYLTKTFAQTNELQFSYTRRINRPHTFMLNPFTDYSDQQNLRKGNPYLKPEYINALEFSYMKYFSYLSASGAVFYRNVSDAINRIVTVVDSTTSISTFANVSKSSSYGLEFILSGSITKWWSINGSTSYSKTTVTGDNIAGGTNNSGDVWSAKLMSSFSFKNLFDFQVSYFYSGKMVTAQGSMDPMQVMDIAIKKDFFDKRASLNLRVSDVLNTMKFAVTSTSSTFDYIFSRRRDSRAVFLTLTIRFGTDPLKNQNKKTTEHEKENQNDTRQNEEY
jgi:outer membrane receptor protein involved in Fe transport